MPRLRPRPYWSAPGGHGLARRSAVLPEPANNAGPPRPALLFLDIEASGLSPESWPIEIGCAWLSNARIEVRSTIILPRRAWSMQHWLPSAQRLHGIRPEELENGRPADLVAADTDALSRFQIVSDNARWDQLWLDRLRGERPRLVVHPLRRVAAERLEGLAGDFFALSLLRTRPPHRAGGDAARLARAWLAADSVLDLAA